MHMLVRGLVYADDAESAVETARHDVFRRLVEHGPFDYFVTFDEEGGGVAGRDRWGEYPPAVRASSERGRQLVEDGWTYTVGEYEESFEAIEEFLDTFDPTAYWEEESVHREYRFPFGNVGETVGPGTYLYDQAGQGIRYRDHLDHVYNHWDHQYDRIDANPLMNYNLYVVPAEVRF